MLQKDEPSQAGLLHTAQKYQQYSSHESHMLAATSYTERRQLVSELLFYAYGFNINHKTLK
jgi:hypothetical protein